MKSAEAGRLHTHIAELAFLVSVIMTPSGFWWRPLSVKFQTSLVFPQKMEEVKKGLCPQLSKAPGYKKRKPLRVDMYPGWCGSVD